MSDNPSNPLESLLTEFALGPSWARAKSEPSAKHTHESPEREHPPRRRHDREENRGRRDGGDRQRQRNDRGEKRGNRDSANRRDFQRGRNTDIRREEFIPPAEGVTLSIVPEKSAIQLVCKEIHQVARVYPLFDIAEIILAERSRCRAIFEISEKHEPFYRCKIDDALFLTKEEALRHLLESPWKNRFVAETTVETDPPKGNFQSVARCGISGKLLGPPNYHGYQTEIRRMHREFFPEMPFESYTAKIRTDRSEDAVNAWLESMKNQTRWRILSDEESATVAAELAKQAEDKPDTVAETPEPAAVETTPAVEPTAEQSTSTPAEETSSEPALPPEQENTTDASPEPSPETTEPAAESPEAEAAEEKVPTDAEPAAPEVKWFSDRAEFERALAAEVLTKTFHITRKAKISAAIPARNLSPGLLARLKATGSHHRKHPAIIIPDICKILESEHMPVFKRKGKLYTGPARPHALALDAVLAERPGQMVKWIRENPPAKLEGLWQAMLPEGSTAPPQGYAADLFWLLQQGHILLYTDDTLVVQDPPKPQEPKKPKQPKKKAVAATERSEVAGQDLSTTSPENSADPAKTTPSSQEEPSETQPSPAADQSEPESDKQTASGDPSIESDAASPEVSNQITEVITEPEAADAENNATPSSTEAANENKETSPEPSELACEPDLSKDPLP